MRTSSLRLRLLALAALSIGTTLALGGLALSLIFERHVERRVADELRIRWDELAAALTTDANGNPRLSQSLSDPRYQRPLSGAYWQIADASGPLLRSRSLWDEVLPETLGKRSASEEAVEGEGPNHSEIYIIERDVVHDQDTPGRHYRLAVALDHAEINALRDSFVVDAAIALTILGIILLLGAAVQASIGLKPLWLLRRQLNDMQTGRSTRLSGRFPDEVAPLAASLNLLLEQQELQVIQARERAGDLAHGLKTPLTILAGEARRLDETGARESATLLREQVAFMRDHVERELARARTRGAVAGGAATDAAETTGKLVRLLKRADMGSDLEWSVALPPGLRVRMDVHDFSEALGNLLDNARKWARSRVSVTAQAGLQRFTIAVIDDGSGIPQEHRTRLMRRGERGSSTVEGSGLGLSIVLNVLNAYGSTLTLAAATNGGCVASFTIEGWIEETATPVVAGMAREAASWSGSA